MKLLVPKLKPGGRNPVQFELEITEGGKVSAKASVRPSAE